MKKLFLLLAPFIITAAVQAENDAYLVDRRSFRSTPTSACVHIFADSNYLESSCQSIGFQNSKKTKSGTYKYQDYIYFYKVAENLINKRDHLLFVTSYKSGKKNLSLGTFQNLNDLNLVITNSNLDTNLISEESKLQNKLDALKDLRLKITSQLESNLFGLNSDTSKSKRINEVIEVIKNQQKIKFLNDELENLNEKNQIINNSFDGNSKKLTSDKAKLSNILKTTIESSIGTN